jgi:hypothetical protein
MSTYDLFFNSAKTLSCLCGLDNLDPSDDYIQTAITTGSNPAYSYIYDNRRQLLDHILLSPTLQSAFNASGLNERYKTIDLGPISDHRAVMVNFKLN